MVSAFSILAALLASTVAATSRKPQMVWDGRLPHNFSQKGLDEAGTSPFNAEYNKGKYQAWADIISFPNVAPSLFDAKAHKPWALNINDKSVFIPGDESSRQGGFRRSEVMPNINNGTDKTVQGITTLHFSVRKDLHRPLNGSHFYHVTFLETADYMNHVWTLNTGTPRDAEPKGQNPEALRLLSGTDGQKPQLLFQAHFTLGVWHNFAIQVDFDNNALNAYYSVGYRPLRRVVRKGKGTNQARGQGQYHIGLIKQPTGPTDNVVKSGYQPSGINEGIVFGGVFIERGYKVTTCL